MGEGKQYILDLLLTCLQQTDNLWDLTDLKYVRSEDGWTETVLATFSSGYTKAANVTMDSGTAMICDVIRQIV